MSKQQAIEAAEQPQEAREREYVVAGTDDGGIEAYWRNKPAAPQPPQQAQEGVVPVDLAKEREFCDREFNASKYMQVVHAPQHFQAYWDGWQAAINVRGATDWRARAIEAETMLRHMSRALAKATDGPTFMGEPAAQQPAVPEGMVLVPREPTDAMLKAAANTPGIKAIDNASTLTQLRSGVKLSTLDWGDRSPLQQAWDAMLAASPTPPQAEQQDDGVRYPPVVKRIWAERGPV